MLYDVMNLPSNEIINLDSSSVIYLISQEINLQVILKVLPSCAKIHCIAYVEAVVCYKHHYKGITTIFKTIIHDGLICSNHAAVRKELHIVHIVKTI